MSRTEQASWILVITAGLALSSACVTPIPAVPDQAIATRGMRVCWRPTDEGDEYVQQRLRTAFGQRLQGAGYVLVGQACDFQVSWSFSTERFRGPGSFTRAVAVLRTRSGDFLDKVKLEFMSGEAPVDEPDRIAILLVNGINNSSALRNMPKNSSQVVTVRVPDTLGP
jgi:hypothetical protein